jgi:predicted transposase YdaD
VEREEVLEEGIEKGREDVARNMLKKGFSCKQTAELAELGIERVRELFSGI